MAFTPEDGTGVVDANAYITEAEFDTYHSDRNTTPSPAPSSAEKTAAIITATDYIESRWAAQFRGDAEFPDTPQGLSFPRVEITDREGNDITGVPADLKKATAEYAASSIAGGSLAIVGDGRVISMDKTGPLETRWSDSSTRKASEYQSYPVADALVASLTFAGSGGNRVYRA